MTRIGRHANTRHRCVLEYPTPRVLREQERVFSHENACQISLGGNVKECPCLFSHSACNVSKPPWRETDIRRDIAMRGHS